MRICIISGIFPPDIGGPATYVPKIATELLKQGHLIKVVCLSDSLEQDDANHYPFQVIRISRKLFKPWRALQTVLTICRCAKDADLLYVNGLNFESMLAAWIVNLPSVYKVVGDYAWERAQLWNCFQGTLDQYQVAQKGLLLKLLEWIRNIPLQHSQKIIVPSIYLQQIIEGWGIPSDKIVVVYNAVEIPEKEEPITLPSFSGKTIVTVGRLVPWKGIDALIKTLLHFPDVRLVIVGRGPLQSNLEDLAQTLGVSKRVLFMGSLPKEQVFSCLKQADAFVLNSSYEGLPHIVLEAMTAGTPIIATDAGGTKEVIEDRHTGLLVPVGDYEELRVAIDRILNHPELAPRLTRNSKQCFSNKFSLPTMVEQVEKILSSASLTAF